MITLFLSLSPTLFSTFTFNNTSCQNMALQGGTRLNTPVIGNLGGTPTPKTNLEYLESSLLKGKQGKNSP